MSILEIPEWRQFKWLVHGFGTRASEGWTRGEGRTWVNQVHSVTVVETSSPGLAGQADAIITRTAGLLLEIRTADCVPVLFVDPIHRAVAAIHAGWRGTAGNIVSAAVARMEVLFESQPGDLQAAIGPGIGVCCFEVGPEVAAQFGLSVRAKVDLAATLRDQLKRSGIPNEQIHATGFCTRCDEERFHSFRRDGSKAGRLSSGIGVRK